MRIRLTMIPDRQLDADPARTVRRAHVSPG